MTVTVSIDLETATLNNSASDLFQAQLQSNFYRQRYIDLETKHKTERTEWDLKLSEEHGVISALHHLLEEEGTVPYSGHLVRDYQELFQNISVDRQNYHYQSELSKDKISTLQEQCLSLRDTNKNLSHEIEKLQSDNAYLTEELQITLDELSSFDKVNVNFLADAGETECDLQIKTPSCDVLTLSAAVQTEQAIDITDAGDTSEIIREMEQEISQDLERNSRQSGVQTELQGYEVLTIENFEEFMMEHMHENNVDNHRESSMSQTESRTSSMSETTVRTPNNLESELSELSVDIDDGYDLNSTEDVSEILEEEECVLISYPPTLTSAKSVKENDSKRLNGSKSMKNRRPKSGKNRRDPLLAGDGLFARTQLRIKKRQEFNRLMKERMKKKLAKKSNVVARHSFCV